MNSINKKNYIKITYKEKASPYVKKFVKKIFNNYDKSFKILDLGCGRGDISKEIKKIGYDVYGVDINESAKEILKNNFKKYDLNKKNYPFEDNFFDIVFTKSVVEHLRDPNVLVDEAYRMLKPGGILICMTPSWKHSYREQFYIDHTHVTPFTRFSLETICELSGFDAYCKYFYQLPFLWKYPFLKIIIKIINLFRFPYRPFYKTIWPDNLNKFIRFSREAMLICIAKKPFLNE